MDLSSTGSSCLWSGNDLLRENVPLKEYDIKPQSTITLKPSLLTNSCEIVEYTEDRINTRLAITKEQLKAVEENVGSSVPYIKLIIPGCPSLYFLNRNDLNVDDLLEAVSIYGYEPSSAHVLFKERILVPGVTLQF